MVKATVWARIIATSVILFPVITVSAAFPLNMLPLADTLLQLLPSPDPATKASEASPNPTRHTYLASDSLAQSLLAADTRERAQRMEERGSEESEGVTEEGVKEEGGTEAAHLTSPAVTSPAAQPSTHGWRGQALRVLLAWLPICLAAAVRDVGKILEINGIFAFVIAFFIPCVLHLAARRACVARFGEAKAWRSPYHSWPASYTWCVHLVLLMSIVLAVFTARQVLRDLGLA